MGKHETTKAFTTPIKPYRKTVLGSNNLAIFLRPSITDILSPQVKQLQQQQQHGEEKATFDNVSAKNLFEMLKDVNKFMVKGVKLYESIMELRICGWIMPSTLILSGPLEDMKVVRHAWVKRHLKSPRGYFIKDLGIVQDFIVEFIPQSPFMSLSTALFDAVADLNHQNIFPTNLDLHDYLKKHYSEIKTPDSRVIHDCLGRLIKNRRLYHNGRGYFILCNENVLNEVAVSEAETSKNKFKAKDNKLGEKANTADALAPFIKGFNVSSSVTTSSSPAQTDVNSEISYKNKKTNETSFESSLLSTPVPTPNPMKKFFKRSAKSDKTKSENRIAKSKVFSCGIGGTLTDSVTILSNRPVRENKLNSLPDKSIMKMSTNASTCKNNISDDEDGEVNKAAWSDQSDVTITSNRRKVKRSSSFGGTDSEKPHKEVSFALIGSPQHKKKDQFSMNNFNGRSRSFGVGDSKNMYQQPIQNNNNGDEMQQNFVDDSMDLDCYDVYDDVNGSFVDDNISVAQNHVDHLKHFPDMIPVAKQQPIDSLVKYQDLGSELSLQNRSGTLPLSVSDLISPPVADSLAQELKNAYDVKLLDFNESKTVAEIDGTILSPRSRRKFGGVPYETQYVTEVLANDEETVKDKNMNILSWKVKRKNRSKHNAHQAVDKSKDSDTNDVKLRPRSLKSSEARKRDQKERNSLLFEEKRASLKVMGMV